MADKPGDKTFRSSRSGPVDHPIDPTRGAKTFQSAGVAAEFKQKEVRKAYDRGDYETGHRLMMEQSEGDNRARHLNRTKLGGAPGGSTFNRDEILIQPDTEKEQDAGTHPGPPSH